MTIMSYYSQHLPHYMEADPRDQVRSTHELDHKLTRASLLEGLRIAIKNREEALALMHRDSIAKVMSDR